MHNPVKHFETPEVRTYLFVYIVKLLKLSIEAHVAYLFPTLDA